MRAREFLESQGGLHRRGQEVEMGTKVQFSNADKQEIQLLGTQTFPQGPEPKFDSFEELDAAIRDYALELNVAEEDIRYTGNEKRAGAALVTVWYDVPNEKHILFAKLVPAKAGAGKVAPVMWSNSDFRRDFGYGSQTTVAQRANMNLKPNSTVSTNQKLEVSSIPENVSQKLASRTDLEDNIRQGLAQLVNNVYQGIAQPVPGLENAASSIEVDFGEVAAPIALITGNFIAGNGYQKAQEVLLGPLELTWQDLTMIEYPDAGNEALYDSYVYIDETNRINISSKDKKGGAAASVTGLIDQIANNPDKFEDVNTKYKEVYELIKLIANPPPKYWFNGKPNKDKQDAAIKTRIDKKTGQELPVKGSMGINGPLVIGVDLEFIDHDEAHMILDMITNGQGIKPLDGLKQNLITPNLFDLIKIKGAKNYDDPAYSLGWHLLAALAKKIANHYNKNPLVDGFFKHVLERSNMVQVKTSVRAVGGQNGGAMFNQFTVIYPPVFEGKIELNADTNYMATRGPVSSGLAFKIPPQ